MIMKQITAAVAAAALLLGITAAPALAERGGKGKGNGEERRISEKFDDMGDYGWGLSDVTKMESRGVFKGRDAHLFAPGAKITHQEAAVAAVRLIGAEADAAALTPDAVNTLLQGMPDQADIAAWARPAVAQLVKLNDISGTTPFRPTEDETRLDVAVLLVKATGHDADAVAAMDKPLSFKDANNIPTDLTGYVYVAVQMRLITGYEDRTFRPMQGVKRVEMAVMMGRADDLLSKPQNDRVRGTVKSVDVAADSLTITRSDGHDATLTLSADASVFVDGALKSLADLAAGMTIVIQLNESGEARYLEAKSVAAPGSNVTGPISALVAPSSLTLGLITVNTTVYPVNSAAIITLNGATAAFADLKTGDTATLTLTAGLVSKVVATRAVPVPTVTGSILALQAPTTTALGIITIGSGQYPVATNATFTLNGAAATFADLAVGDAVALTIGSSAQVTQVAATRPVTAVSGTIIALTPAVAASGTTPASPAQIQISYMNNGAPVISTYTLASTTQILVNGVAAQFSDLRPGDAAKLSLLGTALSKVEVTR